MTTRSSPLGASAQGGIPRDHALPIAGPINQSLYRCSDCWMRTSLAAGLCAVPAARSATPALNSQADRIAVEAGDDFAVRARFERDVTAEPGENGRRRDPPTTLFRERASRETSVMGVNRIELVFLERPVDAIRALPEHRKAGRARNGDRNAAIPERSLGRPGSRCRAASDRERGNRGPARLARSTQAVTCSRVWKMAEFRARSPVGRRSAARRQIGMVLPGATESSRRGSISRPSRRPSGRGTGTDSAPSASATRRSAASKCEPEPNSMFSCPFCIQCVTATKLGMPRSLVMSSTQSRRPVSVKLAMQIADVGIVELAEVHFRPPQPIVPPDRVGIPLHQLEESLDDGFLERVAGRAAVGIREEGARSRW